MAVLLITMGCNKTIDVELPQYNGELAVEMYLEDGKPLRCLLSESLDYNSTQMNRLKSDALVIFSDGSRNDTLVPRELQDWETGRVYNFCTWRIFRADMSKTYTLKVIEGKTRVMTASTKFAKKTFFFDSVVSKSSADNPSKYSVGIKFTDKAGIQNYYRVMITKRLNDFVSQPTDITVSDVGFDGKPYSFFSDPTYSAGDSVMVRIYELSKEHYDFIQSVNNARRASYNLFVQPSAVTSNVDGGIGIFTATLYEDRKIVIR